MKNKLIAWLLVVVMLCLTLSGCAYNYQKKDLSKYASYDVDALYAALTAITIDDLGFTSDETKREGKVADEIRDRLVEALEEDDAITEGVIADGNVVAYCYYITATFGEGADEKRDVVLYAANMAKNKATTLSIYNLEGINDKIGDALVGYDFTNGAYDTDTSTSNKATAGSVVYVTYSYQKGSETKATVVTNERIVLPAAADETTFAGKLIGQSLATTFAKGTSSDAYIELGKDTADTADDITYSNVKINWQVKSGDEITVKPTENPFKDTTTKANDTNGTSRTLKDAKDVTYHIYPVSRTEVPELSSDAIIRDLLADKIAKDTLACFTSEEYKFTETAGEGDDATTSTTTLKAIIEDLVKRYKELSDAKTAYDKDKSDANKATLDSKEEKVNETELAAIIANINKCEKTEGEGEDATVTKASDTIVKEYKELVYDELEETYNGEIKDAVAHEIWQVLSKGVTVNEAPQRAVKEAYKHNYEAYKYEFYEGKKTTDVTNKDHYGTLKIYIAEGVAPELATKYAMEYPEEPTYKDALAVLERHAEEQVKEIMLVYIAAAIINAKVEDANLTVAKTEVESYAYTQSIFSQYIYGTNMSQAQILESYGENNIRTGLLFDKVLSFLMETKEDDDGSFTNITVTKK